MVLTALSVAGPLAPDCRAEDLSLEYQVKAAFLLNFTRFIEWPATAFADAGSPFTMCVLGKDPFARALDDVIEGETAGGRKLSIRRINEPPAPRACQIVFIDAGDKDLRKIISALGPGVLTVGEGAGFVREGGIIGFVIDNRRVRFDINQSAADRAELKLSSKLLSVARAVER
jgi:hypothetical protein